MFTQTDGILNNAAAVRAWRSWLAVNSFVVSVSTSSTASPFRPLVLGFNPAVFRYFAWNYPNSFWLRWNCLSVKESAMGTDVADNDVYWNLCCCSGKTRSEIKNIKFLCGAMKKLPHMPFLHYVSAQTRDKESHCWCLSERLHKNYWAQVSHM